MRPLLRRIAVAWLVGAVTLAAGAVPIVPTDDAQVIETLPGGASRREERQLKRALLQQPGNAKLAVDLARRYMDSARSQGDPRLAGQALALLAPWKDAATAPLDVLLMQATVEQYLHEFDRAAGKLETLVARDRRQPQAWLTLATIRRVQGRYADSDRGCAALASLGVALYAGACRAENDALRGQLASARASLAALLATPQLDDDTRAWLLTTQAELDERLRRDAAAEAGFKAVLAATPNDAYALSDYADFLIAQRRGADAVALLRGQPRTDVLLLRLAIAGTQAGTPDAARDAEEMRERIAQARLRPDAKNVHAREQSMFALQVDRDAAKALALALENVKQQREPIDLIVLAQAARAARDDAALGEARRLRDEMGLKDARLDALL